MDVKVCRQCGAEIDGEGITYRDLVFCSDECCDEFEDQFVDEEEPDLANLNDDDITPDDLGYRDDDLDDELLDDDDDLEIRPEDF